MPARRPKMKMRDVSYYKPKGYEKHVTLSELALLLKKDATWIRQLENENRIPRAKRIEHGALSIRLWSPAQVDEMRVIFSNMKVGRPRNENRVV